MQLGFKWLKELVDFEWDAEELCDRLTMAGVACEASRPVFKKFHRIVAGKIKKVERHPESENLSICTVAIGLKTVTTACGAPNVAVFRPEDRYHRLRRTECRGRFEIPVCYRGF